MNFEQKLREIGLNRSEIKIYLYLLEQGISSPPQISKGVGMARPNVYGVLRRLKEKDLIKAQKKGKRNMYIASDPVAFVQGLERKKINMEKMLPDLRAIYKTQRNKPKIEFFEGAEQLKQIFDKTFSAKEVLGIASTNKLLKLDPKRFKKYGQDLQKKGIVLRDILTAASEEEGAKIMNTVAGGLYVPRFLDEKYGDLPTDILIWDDSIALMTLDEPVFGTVLKDQHLANTFKMIFEVMWQNLATS